MQPVRLRSLDTREPDFEARFRSVLHWSAETDREIEQRVADILADVRQRGDAAVLEYTARFDRLEAKDLPALELHAADFAAAFEAITPAQRDALQQAAARIRDYHQRQLEACGRSWSYRDADGTLLGQKVTPLDRVGIYVPGGKAAYPSSLLMNAVPAHVAGVPEIVMVVPTPGGERNTLVLAAAHVAGVSRAFTIGGAQAVACAGLRHPDSAQGRQDHRPGQCLRGQREEARLRHGRHRHDRRPERDPRAGRRHDAAGLDRDGPVQPGRARRAGAEHPAVPGRPPTSSACAPKSSACCQACPGATSSAPRSRAAAR